MQEHVNVNAISLEKMREFARLTLEAFKKDMEEEAKQRKVT
ncbi:hypothetical protein [Caproiciproducens galactitolivorans]|nr:hypothetical protein [Caproiciproducens galactitolivorans]